MPGYILHLTQAKLVINMMREHHIPVDDQWINRFYLGALLPDTKIRTEKQSSHFWNPGRLPYLAIAPDLQLFLKKYKDQLHGPVMLGYWMHLQLDYYFVEEFWEEMLEFRNDQDQVVALREDITRVWLKEFGKSIPVEDFFSSQYYYGDYSKMNGYLIEKYSLDMPVYESQLVCPVEEVETEQLMRVLAELNNLRERSKLNSEHDIKVFSLGKLELFIAKYAKKMFEEISRMDFSETDVLYY